MYLSEKLNERTKNQRKADSFLKHGFCEYPYQLNGTHFSMCDDTFEKIDTLTKSTDMNTR